MSFPLPVPFRLSARLCLAALAFVVLIQPAVSATYTVNNAPDFNNLPRLNAGDVVQLNSGTYGAINKTLESSISDDTTAKNNPILIYAVTPGGVGATQGLTTIALSGIAPPTQIAAYSLAQQLILTAWNCLFAVACVTIFFGWAGGREIVTNSLVRARTELAEKRAAGRQAKAEREQAGVEAEAPQSADGTSGSLDLQ